MSTSTITASTHHTASAPVLMLAFELGEEGGCWASPRASGSACGGAGIASRDTAALLEQIEWARREFKIPVGRVVSCYEAGRDGFWLHRFLEAHGIESLIIDSSSIEVNRRKRRAKTDRLDVVKLVGLLIRYLAGEDDAFSSVSVPSVDEEDLRQIGRELKLLKKDRTRVSHRMKGLLANQGLVLDLKRDLGEQLERMRRSAHRSIGPGGALV